MTNNYKNKQGLSRYVPSSIEKKIREQSKYGCIFCRCPIVEYEHIEPEFKDAYEHDPEKMTLLCSNHHTEVTKGIIPKSAVAQHRLEALNHSTTIKYQPTFTAYSEVLIGNSSFKVEGKLIILSVFGEPQLWVEHNVETGITISGLINDEQGNILMTINKNVYKIYNFELIGDITYTSNNWIVKNRNRQVILHINFSEKLRFVRINSRYYDYIFLTINIKSPFNGRPIKNALQIKNTQNGGSIIIGEAKYCDGVIYCAGSCILNETITNLQPHKASKIFDFNKNHIGYLYHNKILDLSNRLIFHNKNGDVISHLLNNKIIGQIIRNGKYPNFYYTIFAKIDDLKEPTFYIYERNGLADLGFRIIAYAASNNID